MLRLPSLDFASFLMCRVFKPWSKLPCYRLLVKKLLLVRVESSTWIGEVRWYGTRVPPFAVQSYDMGPGWLEIYEMCRAGNWTLGGCFSYVWRRIVATASVQ
ncbi:hypothetical protein KC19_4G246500 [Ceratodon purpureus]|uniref:Uncharacterized protein n=1 Tax=Ceratodon purpureus TaxID=3225 RepID=A0A8T0IER6_CERPU|nr:hypothetical protein KC19_4G246500 [Ceratodon purpureus]